MVWQFYAYFIEINSPSVLGHQLDSLQWDVRWCVFFLVGDSVPFLASETNKSSCHEKMFWLLKPTNFWLLTQSVPPPHHVASSTSFVAPGQGHVFKAWEECDLCISNIYTVTKMMKTMMPSVYTQKKHQKTSSWKTCKWFAKCIDMSPSLRLQNALPGDIRQELGANLRKGLGWGATSNRWQDCWWKKSGEPVDMENLALFTGFYLRWWKISSINSNYLVLMRSDEIWSHPSPAPLFLSCFCRCFAFEFGRRCHQERNGSSCKRPANNSHFLW